MSIKYQLVFCSGLCKDGEVKLEEDGTPLLYWEQKWSPICGHNFNDDNNGATAFCNKLGYGSGKAKWVGSKYPVASVRIGRCKPGEELTSCTYGGNYLHKLNYRYCHPQESISISITCTQLTSAFSSCNTGKFVLKLATHYG